jgi:serpin B
MTNFKRKVATILALSTLFTGFASLGTALADETDLSAYNSVIDVLNVKQAILNPKDVDEELLNQYDYNGNNSLDYLDLFYLKKSILKVANVQLANTMTQISELDSLDPQVQQSVLNFSLDFFREQTSKANTGENVMLSPQSLYYALGMVVNGANGDTQQEILDTICKGVSVEDFNNNTAYLIAQNDYDTCKIANSIWVREGIATINPNFQEYSEQYFNAEVKVQPFDKKFVKDVNEWVNTNTDGMIPTLLNEVPSVDTVSHLINAICFEADWSVPYNDYQVNEDSHFTNSNGEVESATMLSSEEYIYLHDDNAQGFLKYYKGGKYAFMGILPNENVSVEDYLANLDGETFTNLYNNRITGRGMELYVHIPEFTVEDSYDLKSTLQDLGITTAFDPFSADFGNMISSTRGNVYIDSVTQKTFIQVDRNGTKASAVTDLEANDCAVEPDEIDLYQVYLDRPFIYAIVDTDTGLPVFMGTVNSIAQ